MEEEVDTGVGSARGYDVEPTGTDQVDRVLTEVADLDERPVSEHVAVFERAHEQLRRALDAAPPTAPTTADEQGA